MPMLQMRRALNRLRTLTHFTPVMFVYHLVLLAILAASGVHADIPQYIQVHWAPTNEKIPAEITEGAADEDIWPDVELEMVELVTLEDQNFLTTPESDVNKTQDHEGGDSAVWKIALVAAILLVAVLGCLSLAYYLCVWRGGRVHYQPQKEDYA